MMTLSKALAAGQAKAYFQAEYTNTQESYYSEGETVKGRWFGKQAEAWGLEGDVEQEHFDRLSEGQHPLSGEQLVRHVTSHKYENMYGETVESSEHRAGWDGTFSAPKSVSLAALVGGDERILQAHDRSVDVALNEFEKYTQARMGGNHPAQTTGRLIAAKFQHDSARPDRTTGYAAPQLHTHTVIFNITENDDGRIKPVQPLELYRSQRYATQIYRSVLATELQKLGYEIVVDGRTGAPEIKGFSKEYLAASSPRREEIQREAAEMKDRLAQQGVIVEDGAGLRQAAAKADRLSKQYDRKQMRLRHLEMDAKFGEQSLHSVHEAHERGPADLLDDEIRSRARESVAFARENAGEREAVVDKRAVLVDALRRNLSFTTYEAVVDEFTRNVESGSLIRIIRNPGIEELTTSQTVAMEQSNIRTVVAGKKTQTPVLEQEQLGPVIQEISHNQGITLNNAQREAVEMILNSQDRIIGLEGLAGTGKTTTLSVLREAVVSCGYEVEGFAPTGAAADLLAESGIPTSTLQKFVFSSQTASVDTEKRLYILDESSLSDTRNAFKFFEKVGPAARILLVGDTGQHQAVEAGAPFEQFVKAGMQTASLDQIVRQQSDLRKPVEQLAMRDVIGAVKTLTEQGRVTEIIDDEDRLTAIAKDYVSNPKRTLVISPANQERVAINSMIHRQLEAEGLIGPEDHEATILVNRQDMTGAERKFALSYTPNEDIIRYNKGSKVLEINKGDYGRVVSSDHRDNKVTVRLQDGREITYNPKRLSGVSVYKEATRQFAVGDRIQFRAPLPEANVKNTELATITNIEQGEFTVLLSADRIITFNPERFPHIDHGYAVTSYSSQGKTMDRVLVNAETTETDLLVNQRMAYVAVSRARLDARIYTDCAADLGGALARRRDKTMALEALSQSSLGLNTGHESANQSRTSEVTPDADMLTAVASEDGDSVARLRARAILVDSNVAVAQKQLAEFERSRHLHSVEIDEEQWSLTRVDRQQRTHERHIDYSRRAVSAYRMRLYSALNNPLKLYGLHDYKQSATNAKYQIKESQRVIEGLHERRKTVNDYLENQRAILRNELSRQTDLAQKMNTNLELKIDLQVNPGEPIPQPEFTEKELDRLEANAKTLRDPTMLRTAYDHLERSYGTTVHGIERSGSRANEALKATTEWLSNLNEQIQSFKENREFFPVLFRTTSGSEQIATLQDFATKPLTENVLSRLFGDTRADRSILEEALNQHYADLQQERDASQRFLKTICEIADGYRERMAILTSARFQEALDASAFTQSESLAVQLPSATGDPNSTIAARFSSNTARLNDPTQSRGIREITAATPQPHAADHLQDIRQTIDHIAAQNAPGTETAFEAEIAEAETTASESLAILI